MTIANSFGPKHRAWSGSKLFDTDGIPERNFQKKLMLKKSADHKKACKITQ